MSFEIVLIFVTVVSLVVTLFNYHERRIPTSVMFNTTLYALIIILLLLKSII